MRVAFKTIYLDGVAHTVVGVTPPGFVNVLTPAPFWSALQARNKRRSTRRMGPLGS
jgi:hypothetical protein